MATNPALATHPWITFDLNLSSALPRFWMLMGEVRSKCEHICNVPLEQDTAERLHAVYFAKGVNATTAIEGNTLSEEQVQQRMEGQLELPPSKEYLGREVDNMLDAYNGIKDSALESPGQPITVDLLRNLNKMILDGLEVDPGVVAGEFRTHSVAVGPYLAPPAADTEQLVTLMCAWLNDGFDPPEQAMSIPYAVIRAVVAHIYIEWIHPFGDGNGRLGRLIEFYVLINSGVPLPAAHVLTSHYNETRTEYYRQLSTASRNGGDLTHFLAYAAQGMVDGLAGQIALLHLQQEKLMWRAHVDNHFEGKHTPSASRQRRLAIELGKLRIERDDTWVAKAHLRDLTKELFEDYYGKTTKTLSRDLNRLRDLGYVEIHAGRARALLGGIRGLKPFKAPVPN